MGAAVLALTALLMKACNYLLVDDTSSYTRLTMHELYETADSGENIDTLFLGSSHCFRAYDPQLFTELTGKNSFNLGSSSQNYDTSYYLLREAARYNDLKTVYLDMHYKFLFIDKQDRDLVQANIISDYMRFSLNKLEFLLTTSETDEYTNRFLPFRRNWQQLGDLSYIRSVWEKKQAEKQTKADRGFPAVFTRAREAIMTREAGRQGEKSEAERGKEPERGSQRPGIPTKRPLKSELKGFFSPWTVLERWM